MFLLLSDMMGYENVLTNQQMVLVFLLGLVDYALVRSQWYVISVWSPIIAIGVLAPT